MSISEHRTSSQSRETTETNISVSLNLDGSGVYSINTGNGMFDHMLAQLSSHGLIDIDLTASGDSHVRCLRIVEDTAIRLGTAIR